MNVRRFAPLALAAVLVSPAPAAVPAAPARPAAAPAVTLPVPPLRMPRTVEQVLPNGLRVVVARDTRLPIVHVQLAVPAGSAQEPADVPGVAPLTVSLLRQGTASRTAEQFDDDLARQGLIFATSCDRDGARVACGAMASRLDGALEMMSDAVVNTLFGGADFEWLRDAEAARIEAQHGTLSDVADLAAGQVAFSPHPYAHSPEGDPRTIRRVTLAAVQAFHRDRWRPDRSVLTIAGDVDPDQAFASAREWFMRWSGRVAPDERRPMVRPERGVTLLDVPGSPYCEVRVAVIGPGLLSGTHDSWALLVNAIQGMSLPGNAVAVNSDGREASLLLVSARSSVEKTPALAHELVAALQHLAANPPREAALDSLRRRASRRWPLGIGTLGAWVSQWQVFDASGQAPGIMATYPERLATADVQPVLRALTAPPIVLVVGPAAPLRGPLTAEQLGPVSVKSLLPPDVRESSLPPGTEQERARGRALVDSALAAHGGAKALAAVHTQMMEGTLTVNAAGESVDGQFSMWRADPDSFSFSTRVLKLSSRQVLAGDHGWNGLFTDSAHVATLDDAGVQRLRSTAASDLVHQLRFAASDSNGAVWRGTELVAGRPCELVDYATPWGRQRLALDPTTYRVVELAGGLSPRGAWLDRRAFSGYQDVDGILLPWIEERTLSGERMWRMVTRVAAVNAVPPAAIFTEPQE
jgi:hypothetical protein